MRLLWSRHCAIICLYGAHFVSPEPFELGTVASHQSWRSNAAVGRRGVPGAELARSELLSAASEPATQGAVFNHPVPCYSQPNGGDGMIGYLRCTNITKIT